MSTGDSTELNRARLRWRARRGLLENDLIISRFLDAHEHRLTDAEVQALTQLFEMEDNELLDVLLGLAELSGPYDDPLVRKLVEQMKML